MSTALRTGASTAATETRTESNNQASTSAPEVTLVLQAERAPDERRVQWDESVVDNEKLNKKKSKGARDDAAFLSLADKIVQSAASFTRNGSLANLRPRSRIRPIATFQMLMNASHMHRERRRRSKNINMITTVRHITGATTGTDRDHRTAARLGHFSPSLVGADNISDNERFSEQMVACLHSPSYKTRPLAKCLGRHRDHPRRCRRYTRSSSPPAVPSYMAGPPDRVRHVVRS